MKGEERSIDWSFRIYSSTSQEVSCYIYLDMTGLTSRVLARRLAIIHKLSKRLYVQRVI